MTTWPGCAPRRYMSSRHLHRNTSAVLSYDDIHSKLQPAAHAVTRRLTICYSQFLRRRQADQGPPIGSALEIERDGVDTTTVVAGDWIRVVAGDRDAAVGLIGFAFVGDEK